MCCRSPHPNIKERELFHAEPGFGLAALRQVRVLRTISKPLHLPRAADWDNPRSNLLPGRNHAVENGEHMPPACGLRRRAANLVSPFSATKQFEKMVGRSRRRDAVGSTRDACAPKIQLHRSGQGRAGVRGNEPPLYRLRHYLKCYGWIRLVERDGTTEKFPGPVAKDCDTRRGPLFRPVTFQPAQGARPPERLPAYRHCSFLARLARLVVRPGRSVMP